MATLHLGVFADRVKAEAAISELEGAGYAPKEISIVVKDQETATKIADNTGANVAGGAVAGATTGGVIGGIAGLLVGIGAIVVPGIGALLIGGPIAAVLGLSGAAAATASGAVTGALAGGLLGALAGLGVPEEDAKVYEERISQGGVLLAVPEKEGIEDDVRAIMSDNGAGQMRSVEIEDRYVAV